MPVALKKLSTESMVTVGKRLLGDLRPTLEAQPTTRALLPALEGAVDALLSTQTVTVSRTDLAAVAGRQRDADAHHDRLAGGIDRVLDGWAMLVDSDQERAELEALRARIFPDGLRIIQATWYETAGNAALLRQRLDDAARDKLGETRVAGATLATHLQRMIDQADALGEATRERDDLEARADRGDGPSAADVVRARNRWIRTVNALIAVIELEDPEHERTRAVFQLLDNASPATPARAPEPVEDLTPVAP